MSRSVEFYFDVGSPASYVAWHRLPKVCDGKARIDYKPFLLGGVFQATGNHSPAQIPAKGKYVFDDLARFAQRDGTPFANNPFFPINTLTLMRGAVGLQMNDETRMRPYVDAVFRAIWVDGKNMNDPTVVAAVLQQAGFDPAQLMAFAADPAVKNRLKAITQEAVDRGVFGAPTFYVDGVMYWGQDRIDFVQHALENPQ